jgi:hypothetical protein
MKSQALLTLPLAALALAACTQERPREKPATSPAAKVVGKAESCIPITRYRETRIRDDWTIDFIAGGGKVWRNTLPNRCSGLRAADKFTYETSLSQLCSTDIIYILHDYGGTLQRGAGCGLGKFVPVELER